MEKWERETVIPPFHMSTHHPLAIAQDTVEILHAHVVPQPAPRGKFRTAVTPPSEEVGHRGVQKVSKIDWNCVKLQVSLIVINLRCRAHLRGLSRVLWSSVRRVIFADLHRVINTNGLVTVAVKKKVNNFSLWDSSFRLILGVAASDFIARLLLRTTWTHYFKGVSTVCGQCLHLRLPLCRAGTVEGSQGFRGQHRVTVGVAERYSTFLEPQTQYFFVHPDSQTSVWHQS